MQRTPVDSSTMAAVGYDADSETLEIEFVNGHLYQYFDVPPRCMMSSLPLTRRGATSTQRYVVTIGTRELDRLFRSRRQRSIPL